MTKFLNILKKTLLLTHFGPIFPIFKAKKFFIENPALTHNFIWVSSIMPKFKKTNDAIPRKHPDRRKDRWKDGRSERPYFTGPFQLMLGVQKRSREIGNPREARVFLQLR